MSKYNTIKIVKKDATCMYDVNGTIIMRLIDDVWTTEKEFEYDTIEFYELYSEKGIEKLNSHTLDLIETLQIKK